jgi:hypothetical protein
MLARTATAYSLFRPTGEGRSEGGGKCSAGAATRTSSPRSTGSSAPDVDPDRIGGSACRSAAELMLEAAAKDPDLAAVVSDGAGARQFRRQKRPSPVPGSGP